MPKLFISYRRDDTAGMAGRIYDRLESHFGRDSVFMDVDTIPFGVDFRRHLNEQLNNCDVLLALIGAGWFGILPTGKRRLDDPGDFVRVEIETALQRGIPVTPVLIGQVAMPREDQLPPTLAELAFRNAAEVDPGRDFHNHMDRLIRWLGNLWQLGSQQIPGSPTRRAIPRVARQSARLQRVGEVQQGPTDPTIARLVSEIQQGRNLTIAYRCRFDQNPVTGRTLPTTTFFDELSTAALATENIVVLDFDGDRVHSGEVYVTSYNLAKTALDMEEFSELHGQLGHAIAAHDAPYDSELYKTENPWRDDIDGGAKFIAKIVQQLGLPTLAILRHLHWELDGKTESTCVYGDEILALGSTMSVAFDIWHEDDWTIIQKLIDYFVDDREGERKLFEA